MGVDIAARLEMPSNGGVGTSDYDLSYISPSALSGFRSCPYKWAVGRLKYPMLPQEAKHLDLGSIVHELLARYYRVVDVKAPYKQRERTIDEMFTDNPFLNSIEGLKTKTADVIKGFKKFEKSRDSFFPVFTPDELEKTLVSGRYKCITDLYCRAGEFGIDWKSSSVPALIQPSQPQDSFESYFIQGAINVFLLNELGYPCKKFYFVGLVGCQVVECPIMGKGWVEKMTEEMLSDIKRGAYVRIPNRYCYSCPAQLRCSFLGKNIWEVLT